MSSPQTDKPDAKQSEKDNSKKKKKKDNSDQTQFYKKWIEEDAVYIITEEEKSVYKSLKNDEERDSFIEDFWARRNPDRRSGENSFREEHYRRIAYANDHFASGIPGWRTDRGMIYIKFGKPDQLESHPTGGNYNRPFNEGGGQTSTYPFEKWWYRHIDNMGDDIEIEFVDKSFSGEYRIAMSPDEKDALINVPNAGLTLAEEMGMSRKEDRAYFNPSAWNDPNNPENQYRRAKDSPFSRMEQYFNVQRPPLIKFEDLKSVVSTHVTYNSLPCDLRLDYLKLSADKILVPVTVEINNKDLEFKKQTEYSKGVVNVYGTVTSLSNKIMWEWEDVISVEFSDENFEMGKNRKSQYQKMISLPPGQRYRLDLVLKDENSKNMGSISTALSVPKYDDKALQSSSIILARKISPAPTSSDQLGPYIIGDMKVLPNVTSELSPGQDLRPYLQIYNMDIDQTNQKPSLDVSFTIKTGDKVIEEFKGNAMNSEQLFYGQRVVLVGKIPLSAVSPGKYQLEVKVVDNISSKTVVTKTEFKILAPAHNLTATTP